MCVCVCVCLCNRNEFYHFCKRSQGIFYFCCSILAAVETFTRATINSKATTVIQLSSERLEAQSNFFSQNRNTRRTATELRQPSAHLSTAEQFKPEDRQKRPELFITSPISTHGFGWWWWLFPRLRVFLGECSAIYSPPAELRRLWPNVPRQVACELVSG